MDKTYIFEGKTTNEAIEKGLSELKVSKNKVDIKVLETEDKRSFFSILTPRIVKVEIKLKEDVAEEKKTTKVSNITPEDKEKAKENLKAFLDEFISKLPTKDLKYELKEENDMIEVNIIGDDTGYLIGYRGEVLNSLQNILTNVVSKDLDGKIKVLLNIGGYREKREKDLENLANKIAGSVIKTRKSITLEPMSAYERKIIHLKLQDNDKVQTHSTGEEPYRKIVVSLKK